MNRLYDLRFVIGLFFCTVGVLLIGYFFIDTAGVTAGNINLWSGMLYLLFGLAMLLLSHFSKNRDQEP